MGKERINPNNLPPHPGVYLFKAKAGKILYVGKSINIRERVKAHIKARGGKGEAMISEAREVEGVPAASELEALLLEAVLIKKYLPKYNSQAKDDKHPLYIKITTCEDFPKITTSRREDDPKATYFGPFPSSSTVRQVLRQVRKVFPYCARKEIGKKACFYAHLKLCDPCPSDIVKIKDAKLRKALKRRYSRNIKRIILLLSGRIKSAKRNLQNEMRKHAREEKFEEAAEMRNELQALEYITTPYSPTSAYLENPKLLEDLREAEIKALYEVLRLHRMDINKFVSRRLEIKKPLRIECFDISHTGGTAAVASMVTFIKGEPEKNLYRRFKIRRDRSRDDFSMMGEVIKRRLDHVLDWGEPDLIVVDGGKPQLSAARQYLKGEKSFPVIGLAKRLEEIVVPKDGGYVVLQLRSNNPALKLLQRLRDEAHRFARSYHFKLRMKSLLS
ncbi:MAG: GIY-YIG nuclease family protein [bacterium]|nr:GIY-YIG nuclease family protein [bacterium]